MKWALGLSLFMVGCGHMETHAALLRPAEAPKTEPVEIYIADQASPQRPYYELALVQAIGFGADANAEDVVHALSDRAAAQGKRLNIASGTAVRFEPGQQRTVELVDFSGDRVVYGFRGLTQGPLA